MLKRRISSGIFSVCLLLLAGLFCECSIADKGDVSVLEQAKSLEKTSPIKAAKLYSSFVKANPASPSAADAKYHEGLSYESVGLYYKAYKAYQHVIENYPGFTELAELLDRQYRIGNYYLMVKSKPLLGIPFLSRTQDKSIEIFDNVVRSAPYTSMAAKAQYRLGFSYLKMKKYREAITAFRVVTEKYPGSAYVDDAVYSVGDAYFNLVQGAEYDQYSTEKALAYFNRYKDEYPAGKKIGDVFVKIDQLNRYLAESIYLIGYFYERIGYYESALIYYEDLEKKYGETFFAEKARGKRDILTAMVKLEMPYRELVKNYSDLLSVYYSIKRKDPRNVWEFWRKDPLSPLERDRLNWAKQLIKIAKQHVDEAKKLYDIERKVVVLDARIRDLKKDTQNLKIQIMREEDVLSQLEQGLVKQEDMERLAADANVQADLNVLISKQNKKIRKLRKQIGKNNSKITKLSKKLVVEKASLESVKPVLENRRRILLKKANYLRLEIDRLIAGTDDYAVTSIEDMALKPEKIKWCKISKGTEIVDKDSEPDVFDKPEVIKQLEREAAGEKGVVIPYENHLKDKWWIYLWEVLVGEEDKFATPDDAEQLFIK